MVWVVPGVVHGVVPDTLDADPTGRAPRDRGAAAACWPARAGGDRAAGGGEPGRADEVEALPGGTRHTRAAAAAPGGTSVAPECGPVAALAPCPAAGCRGGRVRDRALDGAADHRGGRAPLRRAVPPALARPGAARPRLEPAGARCPRAGARRRAGRGVAQGRLAAHQKKARRTGRAIVFVD